MIAGVVVAIVGTTAAACLDLRYGRIPNTLLGPMFLSSIMAAFLQDSMIPWTLNVISSSILFYSLWNLRVWAAGDSKLFIVLAALIPEHPKTAFLPEPPYSRFFFLTVLMNLLLIYLLYAFTLILSKSPSRTPRYLATLLTLSAVMLWPGPGMSGYRLPAFILLALCTYNEASKLRLTKNVKISELHAGANLAEDISDRDGLVFREKERPSIPSLLDQLFRGNIDAQIKPSPAGVTYDEKKRLAKLVESRRMDDVIQIYSGIRMSPLILSSLLASLLAGDLVAVLF